MMAEFVLRAAYRSEMTVMHLLWMIRDDQWFCGRSLLFGWKSAPRIFSAIADALEKMGVEWLGHLLDDFVVVGSPKVVDCGRDLGVALETFTEVGVR